MMSLFTVNNHKSNFFCINITFHWTINTGEIFLIKQNYQKKNNRCTDIEMANLLVIHLKKKKMAYFIKNTRYFFFNPLYLAPKYMYKI